MKKNQRVRYNKPFSIWLRVSGLKLNVSECRLKKWPKYYIWKTEYYLDIVCVYSSIKLNKICYSKLWDHLNGVIITFNFYIWWFTIYIVLLAVFSSRVTTNWFLTFFGLGRIWSRNDWKVWNLLYCGLSIRKCCFLHPPKVYP